MFFIREGLIFFSSHQPGHEATLRNKSGYVYPFRSELSNFDDVARQYVWAFDASEKPVVDEDQVIFSTMHWKVIGDVVRSEIRSTEVFSSKTGLVLFSSNQSASHVVMFDSGGNSLPFRGDVSKFDDKARAYTWAFERTEPLCDGERFVVTLGERIAVAEVEKGKLVSVIRQVLVTRGQDGPLGMSVLGEKVAVVEGGESEDEEEGASPLSFPPLPPVTTENGKKRVVR